MPANRTTRLWSVAALFAVALFGLIMASIFNRSLHAELQSVDVTQTVADAIEQQVSGVTDVLERLGVTPSRIYRTPHGYKSSRVFEVAARHGLTLWAWSRGVWDTDRPEPAVLVRRATRLARSGMVLLLHDGRGHEMQPDIQPMLAALPAIIRELKQRGFTFVRVGDA